MALRICSLSSGSAGNSIFVASDNTQLLIDVGVPLKTVEKSVKLLGASLEDAAVLVTHSHSDHIKGVPEFTKKYGGPVYAHHLTAPQIKQRGVKQSDIIEFNGNDFFVGDLIISPFKVSHDVPCVGYQIYHKNNKVSILTDLGTVDEYTLDCISDSSIVLIEANHDEELVKHNTKYPYFLKRRILSNSGHLSNGDCAEAVAKLVQKGVSQIILAHLSKENNYPELAFNTVSSRLKADGITEGKEVKIEVAKAFHLSGLYEIC